MTSILSFGGGVNSTAILVLHAMGKIKLDAIIFADTGSELPETYEYMEEYIKSLCAGLQLPFHRVAKGDLFQYYWEKKLIPFRIQRQCTDKYKIRPIKAFMKEKYPDAITVIGIDYGERHRAERFRGVFEFPLIDMEINRDNCERIIQNYGLPIPVKSGCFFCPFTKKQGWINLLRDHRDLFLKAECFEQNSKKYPKFTLTRKPLQRIRESIENQQSLCDWIDQEESPCLFCHT